MTIKELMYRVAGTDLEWTGLDEKMLREMGPAEVATVEAAVLTGVDQRDKRPYMFRLPIEKLRRRTSE